MLITSEKFVDLPNGHYLGLWTEYFVVIAFVGEEMEIPVSHGNMSPEPKRVDINVVGNQFQFDAEE
jgi:hypothetical protein